MDAQIINGAGSAFTATSNIWPHWNIQYNQTSASTTFTMPQFVWGAWNSSIYDQQKELTRLRASDAEWRSIPVEVARSPLHRLHRAFRDFFRRVKSGDKPGFPRYRAPSRYGSFELVSDLPRIENDRVNVPKIGMVRFHKYRELRGSIKCVRIRRASSGRWHISFVCDVGVAPAKVAVSNVVGIDMGLEAFTTLSNGERVDSPRFFRAGADALACRQRAFARKKRGSSSRQRAKKLVARAHEHIRNQRINFARKLACALYARFDLVAHEDLQISRMVHGNLGKSINDAAWGQFLIALHSKAENAGKWCVPVDPRGTSQTCAACGTVAKKTLDQRQHECSCGFSAHRDHNAALVILGRGLRPVQLTEASQEA